MAVVTAAATGACTADGRRKEEALNAAHHRHVSTDHDLSDSGSFDQVLPPDQNTAWIGGPRALDNEGNCVGACFHPDADSIDRFFKRTAGGVYTTWDCPSDQSISGVGSGTDYAYGAANPPSINESGTIMGFISHVFPLPNSWYGV